ncbi:MULTISPECIES: gamma-glutamyltransferase [Cyanophyceae]|uniref:gamma-glutamyltransferase n=1 Tax=Cyanophyceae TaxID=3028117 RepID=UPI001688523B|nr:MULTISPECIES: gamma-glutamyltransferase [Cyanophyceae]MBD1914651.1 gamma-glutamyltransferase [Phormidium sp. FACHB-77]MBD2028464.1 gamma-glutamyltransferase [Phormidium sp. FACHB-322]MBD2053606.1 gamma-glutamyltransferase [Leptolyngbya sp. FACHB-60]
MVRRIVFGLLGVCICVGFVLLTNQALLSQAPAFVAQGRGGAVATVDTRATQIGIDVLKRGGNAIDAAVAAAAALGVSDPFSAGIGGGGFMVIYLRDSDRIITLDGREQAPASAQVDMFKDPDSSTGAVLPFSPNRNSSGVAVGVPGTPLEWAEALNRYGTLSLAEALQPAIALATDGFAVDANFAAQVAQNQARFAAFTSTQALYLPDGRPPAVGSRFKNPDLANTYRLLAGQGVNAFYRGEIAAAIAQTVQRPPAVEQPPFRIIPGGMTLTDLDRYEVRVRPPTVTTYRGFTLYSMGLPSSGGITTGEIFSILEGFDLGESDRAKAWHTVLEAERLAFADRNAYLGDPEYVDVPLTGLRSADFIQTRRALIGDSAPEAGKDFRAAPGDPLPYQNDPSPSLTVPQLSARSEGATGISTTHLVASDRLGNLVSYTLTLESIGGSGIVVPGYGFILNNELTDFDPVSPHPNAPEPGKRPRSSMAPTIARSPGGDLLAFGSPGGSTIITTVVGLAVNLIDFGMTLPEAIAAPRLSQRNTGITQVDGGFEQGAIAQALAEMGHVLEPVPEIGAAAGLIVRPDGSILAAAEPTRRGGGTAMVVEQ